MRCKICKVKNSSKRPPPPFARKSKNGIWKNQKFVLNLQHRISEAIHGKKQRRRETSPEYWRTRTASHGAWFFFFLSPQVNELRTGIREKNQRGESLAAALFGIANGRARSKCGTVGTSKPHCTAKGRKAGST